MPPPASLRTGSILTLAAAAFFGAGWFTARRSGGPAAAAPETAVLPAGAAEPGTGPPETRTGSRDKPSAASKTLPPAAVNLLKSLSAKGGLKSQAAILQYASSLNAASARSLAMSSLGKGWNMTDKNTSQLYTAVFSRWAELDPEGIIQAARTTGDRYFRWRAVSAGFDSLAETNPNLAWEQASKMGNMKNEAQRSVISSLSATNPQAAFDLAAGLKGYDGGYAMRSVMGSWAEKDPEGASAAVLSLPAGPARSSALPEVMTRWAANDYTAATAWAATLPNAQERVAATGSALYFLSQSDPEKSLSLVNTTDVGNYRSNIISQAISTLAYKDFDGAMGRVAGLSNFMDKSSALGALAGAVTDENRDKLMALAATLPANLARSLYENGVWNRMDSDPAGTMEAVQKIPIASVREQAMAQAVQSLSYRQPEEATALFSKLQSVSQKPEMAAELAGTLAWTNPEKAVAWANELGTEALKKSALVSAISNWAQNDPEKAGGQISKITNADTRAEVTRSVADSLAGRSLGEAEKWADSLTGADKSAALGKVVEQAATQAPDRVESLYSRFVAGLSPEDSAKSENQGIARTVATQIAQTDAGKAAAWSLSLPEGGARDQAVSGVVSTWAAYDAVGASQWVQTLPEGKGRDLAAGNLVTTIARDDPESAWAWATSIGDNARRREAAAAALEGWKANGNRAAAQAALDAAGFSGADHQELARKLE